VTENPQKNYSAFQVLTDRIRHISTQNMPDSINKC